MTVLKQGVPPMMTVTKPSPNRVDIVLSGLLDTAEMGEALDDLIAQSADVTHGQMLYTVQDFEMPTLGAITAEIARMPNLLSLLTRFDKCAVLTDSPWLRTAAEFEGAMIPMISIKGFALADTARAEAWLADKPDDENEEPFDNLPV